ncbi:MAG TPA: PLP-dependent aminotransferase family protein [Blastocatellia bacterium]|nr:PLP-dependent aminotransferase family protein [Blastocatellia bacterium]
MIKSEPDYQEIFSFVGREMRPNAIRKMTALLGRGDVISLSAGAPSHETFPLEELSEIAAQVIRERGRFALQYGPTRGQSQLVQQVADIMRGRGVENASPSNVVLTTGSQQGLDLISRVILDPGDIALVELPSYVGGTIALHNARAELVGVRQDEGGIVIGDLLEKLEAARRDGRRVKCLYTIPNFQNPSGVTLSGERRRELVDIADEHDLLLIEDDAYYELYFTGASERFETLAALRPSRAVYLSSFSKVLAPGLRAAWLCAPEEIASKVELAKEGADLSSSLLDQSIVSEALRSGLVERRLPEIRGFYRTRCRAMLEALERCAPAGATWTSPLGGFFILMKLASGVDATKVLPDAIEAGVAYVPGQPFFVDNSGTNTLRLAYSKESPEAIKDGIERLCRVLSR